jgi:hypothetical protein
MSDPITVGPAHHHDLELRVRAAGPYARAVEQARQCKRCDCRWWAKKARVPRKPMWGSDGSYFGVFDPAARVTRRVANRAEALAANDR